MKPLTATLAPAPTFHLFNVSRIAALLARRDAPAHFEAHCPMLALQLTLETAIAGYRIRR